MVNGVIAELYPEDVKKVFEAGHSIHAHSYGMDVIPIYLDEVQEKINIEKNDSEGNKRKKDLKKLLYYVNLLKS